MKYNYDAPNDYLAHYGVKGMKRGVRRNLSRNNYASNDLNYRRDEDRNPEYRRRRKKRIERYQRRQEMNYDLSGRNRMDFNSKLRNRRYKRFTRQG